MPSTLKIAVCLTFGSAILIASMFPRQQPAAQQTESQRQQTQRWVNESIADLDRKTPTEPSPERRRAEYETCAHRVQADYDDDPEQAYGWIRTLCHR